MDRTLFSPAMIETYRACKKAYELAFLKPRLAGTVKLSIITKRILLRGFAEIHRGQVKTITQAQQWIGQQWSMLDIKSDAPEPFQKNSVDAFRYAYRAFTSYVTRPYKPAGSEVVGVNVKFRARVPQSKAYIEDVFDLLLWHPHEEMIEIVDYHISPLQQQDAARPKPSVLIKQFLVQKIQARYPFKKIKLTYARILPSGIQYQSTHLDDAVFRLQWPQLAGTIEEMKSATEFQPQASQICGRCPFASECPLKVQELRTCEERRDVMYRSA